MQKTAVIFGGTGFVGRNIVKALAQRGMRIKIATRVPEAAFFLKPLGDIGQIVPVAYDPADYNAIAELISGADYVFNCVGILFEKPGKQSFTHIHAELPESIATAAAISNVKRLIHISALGIDTSSSNYAASKLDGEKRVLKAFPNATILRPSIIFGKDDDFFNKFAKIAQVAPFLPLIGGGHTQFQPIYIEDVVKAALQAIDMPTSDKTSPLGKIYELGGAEVFTFKQIFEKLLHYTGLKRCLVPLPFEIAKMQASILSLLPKPLLTKDQVESLKSDNIVGKKALTLSDLNIEPTSLDIILPTYLTTYRPGGRFSA